MKNKMIHLDCCCAKRGDAILCCLLFVVGAICALSFGSVSFSSVSRSFMRGEGGYVLPEEVQQMKAFVEMHGPASFRLSPEYSFEQNFVIHQRATEYLYPVRLEPSASLVFGPIGAPDHGCRVLGNLGKVVAYACE